MKKRKIKETLGYDPLAKMMPSDEPPPMVDNGAGLDGVPSHDISFIDFIDNLLDCDVDNRAAKGRRAQADMLKKLSQKKEKNNRANTAPAADLPRRNTMDVLALSEAYEHLLTPVLIVDKKSCVVSVNRQAQAWFSRNEADLLGESVHLLFKAYLGDRYNLDHQLNLPFFKSFNGQARAIELSVSRLPQGEGELLFQWCDNSALEQSKQQHQDKAVLLAAANAELDKQRAAFAKHLDAAQLSSRADLDRLRLAYETKQKQHADSLIGQFNQVMARNDAAYRRSESVIHKVTDLLMQLTDNALSHRDEGMAAILDLKTLLSDHDQGLNLFNDHMAKLNRAAECLSANGESHLKSLKSSQKNQVQLKDASQAIEEIASVIDALAFQTNMLALNAAVEAARAGEEGRGFAIIASEVKRVSKNSSSIAKDIKAVLSKNDEYLKNSDRLAAEADASVTQMMADVATFNHEFATTTQATKKIALGVDSMRNHLDGLNTVPDSQAELAHQLTQLIARLQRYIDDVADDKER